MKHAIESFENPSGLLADRLALIKRYCMGKTVLDLGSVDHASDHESGDEWLHKVIKGVAKEVVGVDFEEDEVRALNEKGYNIVVGNVENVRLNRKFDVVTAGELIEHLSNPGLFLDTVREHLADDGVAIITTPNAYAIRYHLKHLIKGIVVPNAQHTAYFDYYTLKGLVGRHGFVIAESHYFFDTQTSKIKYFLSRLVTLFRKTFAPRILLVLKKK